MSAYPSTTVLSADVIKADGGIKVGCTEEGGVLYPALAPELKIQDCPEAVRFAAYADKPGRFILVADSLYYCTDGKHIYNVTYDFPADDPFLIDVQGTTTDALIVGDGCVSVIKSNVMRKYDFNQRIYGGVLKNGRIFAVDREDNYTIRWSGTAGWDDWEENINGAGRVSIYSDKGKILNLAVYKQKILAVCELGLVVMSAYGTPENFKLVYIDGSTGKICKNTTACAAGKALVFSERGLFAYNGINVEKLNIPLADEVENAVYAFSNGDNYFVCGYNARLERNVLYVFDIQKLTGYVVDIDATALCFTGEILCFASGGAYKLGKGENFGFVSGRIDFGTRKRKVLKSLHVGCDNPVDVEVKSGGKTRILRGVRGYCRPNLSGTSFEITLRGEGKLCGAKAYAEVINGV